MPVPDVLTEVRKRRGPFTQIVVGLVIAWVVLGGVRVVLAVLAGQHVLEALRGHGGDLVSVPVLLVLLLFVVADVWVAPRLPNARSLTRSATWVASGAVALEIGARTAGLWDPLLRGGQRALGVADLVVSSVVPVLLCVALATVAKAAQRAEVQADVGSPAEVASGSREEAADRTPGAEVEASEGSGTEVADTDDSAPTWNPDVAAGAAWTTAAEAARGGGAVSWGDERDAFGWQPPEAVDRGGDEQDGERPPAPRSTAGRLDRGLWDPPQAD